MLRTLTLAALGIIVLGAGCANPFRKNPEQVLTRALERASSATSVRTVMDVSLTVTTQRNGVSERGVFTVRTDGQGAVRSDGGSDVQGTTSLALDAPPFAVTLALEQRTVGTTTYLKLTDLAFTAKDVPGAPPQAQADLVVNATKGILGGQWITISAEDAQSLAQQFGASKTTTAPPDVPAMQRAVREALRTHPIFTLRENLGSARMDGVRAYHYRVGINRATVDALLAALAPMFGTTPEDLATMRLGLNHPDILAALDAEVGEVWIAKRGQDLLRVRFPIDLTKLPNVPAMDAAVTVTLDLAFREWGKPVTVAAPEGAKTVQDLLGGFLPLLTPKP